MKPVKTQTLWKRETSAKQPQTEFDEVVYALTAFTNSDEQANLVELLTVLQSSNFNKNGKTTELFSAVQNVLENLKLELIDERSGVSEILRDVVAFLVETRTTTTLEREHTRIDELLERLDFVASGGTDDEVPRTQATQEVTRPADLIPKLPIEHPKNFEDPTVVNQVERLRSLNAILRTRALGNTSSECNHRLQLEQLQLANYCLNTVNREITIELREFAGALAKEVSHSLREIGHNAVNSVEFEASKDAMYRSLAEVLHNPLSEVAITIGSQLVSGADTSIQFRIKRNRSCISFAIAFTGLRTAFDLIEQRMDELSSTSENSSIFEPTPVPEELVSKTTKTPKEQIAHKLVELHRFVDGASGQFSVSGDDDNRLTVNLTLPTSGRVIHTLPVEIGTDTFLIEAHLVTAILDSSKVHWDDSHSNVKHESQVFQHCVIDDDIKPIKFSKDSPTWMLLLDTTEHKLALEVEIVGTPVLQFSFSSSSEISQGHKFLGENKLELLIDPMDLRCKGWRGTPIHKTPKKHFLCVNVSKSVEDKIKRCIDTRLILMRHTSTLADTISQLQEYRPDFLVIEEGSDELRANDAITSIANSIPLMCVQILVFGDVELKPNLSVEKFVCLAKDADFGVLKNVLVANQDSAKSV